MLAGASGERYVSGATRPEGPDCSLVSNERRGKRARRIARPYCLGGRRARARDGGRRWLWLVRQEEELHQRGRRRRWWWRRWSEPRELLLDLRQGRLHDRLRPAAAGREPDPD